MAGSVTKGNENFAAFVRMVSDFPVLDTYCNCDVKQKILNPLPNALLLEIIPALKGQSFILIQAVIVISLAQEAGSEKHVAKGMLFRRRNSFSLRFVLTARPI